MNPQWVFALLFAAAPSAREYPLQPAAPEAVTWDGSFWAERLETNRKVTIPHCLQQLEQQGSLGGFRLLAGDKAEKYHGYMWGDSDVYKTLQGIVASLRTHPDPELQRRAETIIGTIVRAQAADGYLFPHLQITEPRYAHFTDETTRTCESYSMGHMIESAVTHFQATGRREYLQSAVRCADLLARVHAEGKLEQISGHPGIELALVRLAQATGQSAYVDLARSYVQRAGSAVGIWSGGRPFLAHDEAVGHAVAACYLYCGATDVAVLTGDTALLERMGRKWENMVGRKMHVTGGIGLRAGEAFGADYELPNAGAYCETCAAIASILFTHRLFLAHGDARYLDVLERTLYNGFLAGVGMSGDRFFYPNPLATAPQSRYQRVPWFGCPCCPTNVVRFFPTLGQFVYATGDAAVYVNLYTAGQVSLDVPLAGGVRESVRIVQQTRYPWDGRIRLIISPASEREFTVCLRIPGSPWRTRPACETALQNPLHLNSQPLTAPLERGFARIRRVWKPGDVVELDLPMPIRRVYADPRVQADVGRVAIQRGPIVYCVEAVDQGGRVGNLVVPPDATLTSEHRADLLGGVTVVTGKVQSRGADGRLSPAALTAIPYYAWNHRGPGEMAVWLVEDPATAAPRRTARWVGTNYTPAYCVNQVQMWHDFRPEAVDRELAAARTYFGINTLRVYLHNLPYDAEKERFLANIERFLTICRKHEIRPGFTFFDDCHRHEGIELDKPTEPVKGYHNGRWAACPQDRQRKPENLPKFRNYVQDVIRAHARDDRVLWWEVFNEPNRSEFSASLRRQGYAWAKEMQPMQPVLCCWDDSPETDVVDAHNYSADFAGWDRQADMNPDKGAVFTEAGARWYARRPSSGEPCEVVPWLARRKAAGDYVPGVYLCWELMVGQSNCRWYWGTPAGAHEPTVPWCGLLWPDGTPVSLAEAESIRRWTTGTSRAMFFDDFQDAPAPHRPGWTVYGGAAGSRVLRLEPGQKMLAGDSKWTDYILEAAVMLHGEEGNAGLVFRANDPGPGADQLRGYYVGFDAKKLYLGKMHNNWQPLATFDLAKLDCRVVPDGWNLLRVAVAGPRIRVWFNRMHPSADKDAGLRIDVTDAAPILSGSVGVRSYNVGASFDNLIVLPPDALPQPSGSEK